MTLLFFGKSSPKRRKKPAHAPGRLPSQPQLQSSNDNQGYHPSQTTTTLHIPKHPPAVTVSPASPAPQPIAYPPSQPAISPPLGTPSSPPPIQHWNSSPAWIPPPGHLEPYQHPPDPYVGASVPYLPYLTPPPSDPYVPSEPPVNQAKLSGYNTRVRGTLKKSSKLASQSFSNLNDTMRQQIAASQSAVTLTGASVYQKGSKIASQSVNNLNETFHDKTTHYMAQTAAFCDMVSTKLDEIITSIDGEVFGDERELVYYQYPQYSELLQPGYENQRPDPSKGTQPGQLSPQTHSNYFAKVWLYGNSRLPPHLPPLKLYMPTYPLLCLAAQYSEKVYTRPTGPERETHVDANWRSGTKAMVLKSVPLDDMNTIVFAVRGSQTFMDWAVNFRPAPSSPQGFLDDPGNLIHSGFLYVARKMVAPVAARLQALLSENPHRSACSLLITGHSAGGAVAALLYAHMLSTTVNSELTRLTSFFKRVHCVTFGAPPVSLLPLKKPNAERHKKSLFFAFINEGDPVARADKQVVKSLLRLYTSSVPHVNSVANLSSAALTSSANVLGIGKKQKRPQHPKSNSWAAPARPLPTWEIPAGTLSCAGRLVLLRERPGNRMDAASREQNIEACVITDEQLREVVFGDPVCHMMRLYARRIEILATKAVTVGGMS